VARNQKDDAPMAETNDLSYRLLHRAIPLSELTVEQSPRSARFADGELEHGVGHHVGDQTTADLFSQGGIESGAKVWR